MKKFLDETIKTLGTAACPPYHLALVIGGLSAEQTLKTVKLASARYYDDLPTSGDAHGRAFRDLVSRCHLILALYPGANEERFWKSRFWTLLDGWELELNGVERCHIVIIN